MNSVSGLSRSPRILQILKQRHCRTANIILELHCRVILLTWGCAKSLAHTFLKTHWGRVTHLCVSELSIIRTNAGMLLIGPLQTNFSEIFIEIHIFSFKKVHLKILSGNGGHFVGVSTDSGLSLTLSTTELLSSGELHSRLVIYWSVKKFFIKNWLIIDP